MKDLIKDLYKEYFEGTERSLDECLLSGAMSLCEAENALLIHVQSAINGIFEYYNCIDIHCREAEKKQDLLQ